MEQVKCITYNAQEAVGTQGAELAAKGMSLCLASAPRSGVGSVQRAVWFSTVSRVLNFP